MTRECKYDFFISYADDAQEWVDTCLVPRLEREGKRFLREKNFEVGQSWVTEVERAIEQSHKVIVILTPEYVANRIGQLVQWMTHTKGAEEKQWPLLPILFKPIDRPLLLRSIGVIDLTDPKQRDAAAEALVIGLELDRSDELKRLPPSPYLGMVSFQQEDAGRFFGREAEIDKYILYLQSNGFLALIGSSGCGKSSLVNAGIIPKIKNHPRYTDELWAIRRFRPGNKEFQSWLREVGDIVVLSEEALRFGLLHINGNVSRLLVFIDQFEEIFSLDCSDGQEQHKQERLGNHGNAFLQDLQRLVRMAVEGNGDVLVILAVRDEFFPQLAWCKEWLELDQHLRRVTTLGRKGLEDAIRKPAASLGVWLDPVLIERLVTDAGDDPGILPFVQETMRVLWERIKPFAFWEITLNTYEGLGENGISGLRYAITNKAESAYRSLLSDQHRNIARRIFIRLIQFGEGRPDTRRQQPVSKLRSDQDTPNAFEDTLKYLSSEKYRLLILSGGDKQEARVDIVHESLISAWSRLGEWLIESKEMEKKRRYLLQRANEWDGDFSGKSGFLDKMQLKDTDAWLKKSYKYGYVDDLVRRYFEGSLLFYRKTKFKQMAAVLLLVSLVPMYFFLYSLALKVKVLKLNQMVYIEGGQYNIGRDRADAINYSSPQWKVDVGSFWIGKFEVSNDLYCSCVKARKCSRSNNADDVCDPRRKEYPVVEVTLKQAKDYCQWLGMRIPDEIEWEIAARTKNDFIYPFGNDISGRNINVNMKNDPDYIEKLWPISHVGDDISKNKIYGLAGNVQEWTVSPFVRYCKQSYFNSVASNDLGVVVKGGNTSSSSEGARVDNREPNLEGYPSNFVGFRCVSSAQRKVLIDYSMKECIL